MALILTDSAYYNAIAAAIRTKNGTDTKYKPSEMAAAILAIETKPEVEWTWDAATWADIYDVCKQKQNGTITEWPTGVKLGAKKVLNLSTSVLGSTSIVMRLVGIETDGVGVLTFLGEELNDKTLFGSSATYSSSTVRSLCQDIYNACEAKTYIKSLTKKTNTSYNSTSLTSSTETVWVPSAAELGLIDTNYCVGAAEFTSGVSTQYANATWIGMILPNGSAWTRTRSNKGASYVATAYQTSLSYDGCGATTDTDLGNYLCPAFAIG